MRYPVALLTIGLANALVGSAAGQAAPDSFVVKKCDEPKVPLGALPTSAGTVNFKLGKDGKSDTSSLAVTKVLGMSVAGFHSVAARQLSACRFDVEKAHLTNPVTVSVELGLRYSEVTIGTLTVTANPAPALALEPFTLARDTMPFAADDRRVEERPRSLSCASQARAPTVIHANGATAAQAQADAQEQARVLSLQRAQSSGGTLTAMVRISTEGKPGSQIRVISISNPAAAQSLGDQIGNCKYVPGRILGVPVPALLVKTVP